MRQRRRRHARRTVVDGKPHALGIDDDADANAARCIGISLRIGEQVVEQLRQAARIAIDHGRGLHLLFEDESGLRARVAMRRQRVVDDVGQIDHLEPILQCARIGERQLIQILDQSAEPRALGLQRIERLRRGRSHAVLHGLDFAFENAERRAQFVRDVRAPFAARVARLFERGGQMIEVARQRAEFVVALGVDAPGQIARRERARSAGERAHRREQPARQRERQQQCTDQDGRAGDRRAARLRVREGQVRGAAELRHRRQPQRADRRVVERHRNRRGRGRHAGIACDERVGCVDQHESRHDFLWSVHHRMSGRRFARMIEHAAITGRRRWTIVIAEMHDVRTVRHGLDQVDELGRIAAQEIPVAMLSVGSRQTYRRRRETLLAHLVDVAEKAAPETVFLPQREAEQGKSAEDGESKKQALPESHIGSLIGMTSR